MLTLVTAFLIAAVANLLLIRFSHLHENLTGDFAPGPQKVHTGNIPRIGGVGILLGILVAGVTPWFRPDTGKPELIYLMAVVSLPAFISGLCEDITKRVPPWVRLLGAVVSAVLGMVILGAAIKRVGFSDMTALVELWPVTFLLTALAVAGMAHAVNIIDGFNGLSAGVALLILFAIAYVAFRVGDLGLFHLCVASGGAVLGFLIWNYPAGLMFLGDGGAYLLGVVIAESCILLVMHNPQVSPWFSLLVVIYPTVETIFTIYRRLLVHRSSPGAPDALHLHSLIYRRLLSWALSSKLEARALVRRNSMTALYLWGLTGLCIIPAVIFYNKTYVLLGCVVAFAAFYIWLYACIVKFRTPVWLRRLFQMKRYQDLSMK